MGISSKSWGNLEGIWGNPGEIPHIGSSVGSKGLIQQQRGYIFELIIIRHG